MKKLLIINIAALGHNISSLMKEKGYNASWTGLLKGKVNSVFPAVTCSVQASFKTASTPDVHGMTFNGFFDQKLCKPLFWEQSSKLLDISPFWNEKEFQNIETASLFWQQSLDSQTDIILSPAPIHKHHGGMIQDCYSRPADLYNSICEKIGSFNLMNYWGPFAGIKSSQWISEATIFTMKNLAPDLVLTYLPHLDYILQKEGLDALNSEKAFNQLGSILDVLIHHASQMGYHVIFFGDYAMQNVDSVVYPNKILKENGLFKCREIKNMLYPDYYATKAIAVTDHQIAHIMISDKKSKEFVKSLFDQTKGIQDVLDTEQQKAMNIFHENSGDLILLAEPNAWFSYKWWDKKKNAPDYASHVDIHNKPGFDPCELFMEWPNPFKVSSDDTRIKGSHGICSKETSVIWGTDIEIETQPKTIIEIAEIAKNFLRKHNK
ncbi:MAG: alkaline phosphatase family protein [Verrucomicrobiota bacterium]|nr:alkaline phosphatase family protein [Verrucomicrobiota bacterium]